MFLIVVVTIYVVSTLRRNFFKKNQFRESSFINKGWTWPIQKNVFWINRLTDSKEVSWIHLNCYWVRILNMSIYCFPLIHNVKFKSFIPNIFQTFHWKYGYLLKVVPLFYVNSEFQMIYQFDLYELLSKIYSLNCKYMILCSDLM